MSFRQLYYTSCERGLSGYAGYQFNAVTPGTTAETRRQVESLTGYEAPHSLAYAEDPADLAKCPVNLCYAPGESTIMLNVRYVGRDASRRFGNFFAHALSVPGKEADGEFGGILPIELWRAPFWVADQAPSPDLPDLPGPLPPGWLNHEEASRFLAAHPGRAQIPAMLSAVGLACSGAERPVLIVEDDVDDVARWFAVICYLLPPRFVRQVSFATYLSRPSRSRLHLIGTVSEANLDLGSDAMENFCLFDFPAGRFSQVVEHPLACLAARFELPVAATLWEWAQAHAGGGERTLDDWHPLAAAFAALGQVALDAGDVAAATNWLESASYLPAARQSEIAWALHDSQALTTAQLPVLRAVAKRNADHVLYEQAECELLEVAMHAAMSAEWTAGAAGQGPVTEPAVRERLSARCQEVLQQCVSGPESVKLLGWAAQAGLTLDGEVVIGATRNVIGPWLATDIPPDKSLPAEVRQQAAALARRSPQFRTGLVIYIAGLAGREPDALPPILSGLVGALITDSDLRPHPALFELRMICQARRPAPDILAAIAVFRAGRPVDHDLLVKIWPSGLWTRSEALDILAKLDPRQDYSDVAAGWFYQATESELATSDIAVHVDLCRKLITAPVARRLTAGQRKRIAATVEVSSASGAKRLADLLPVLERYAGFDSAQVRQFTHSRLTATLARLDCGDDVTGLIQALNYLDDAAFHIYAVRIRKELPQQPGRLDPHLAALWIAGYAGLPQPLSEAVNSVFSALQAYWSRKQLLGLVRLIDAVDPAAAAYFKGGVEEVKTGRTRRAVRKASGAVGKVAMRRRGDQSTAAPAQDPDSGG